MSVYVFVPTESKQELCQNCGLEAGKHATGLSCYGSCYVFKCPGSTVMGYRRSKANLATGQSFFEEEKILMDTLIGADRDTVLRALTDPGAPKVFIAWGGPTKSIVASPKKEEYQPQTRFTSVCKCDIKDLLSRGHDDSCGYKR